MHISTFLPHYFSSKWESIFYIFVLYMILFWKKQDFFSFFYDCFIVSEVCITYQFKYCEYCWKTWDTSLYLGKDNLAWENVSMECRWLITCSAIKTRTIFSKGTRRPTNLCKNIRIMRLVCMGDLSLHLMSVSSFAQHLKNVTHVSKSWKSKLHDIILKSVPCIPFGSSLKGF